MKLHSGMYHLLYNKYPVYGSKLQFELISSFQVAYESITSEQLNFPLGLCVFVGMS